MMPSEQVAATIQGAQSGPPQSTSVSLPFMMPSEQVAATIQGAQSGPPQSTSVSLPFMMPSEQVGAVIQGSQSGPPQSTPSSWPFWTPSLQVAVLTTPRFIVPSVILTSLSSSKMFPISSVNSRGVGLLPISISVSTSWRIRKQTWPITKGPGSV